MTRLLRVELSRLLHRRAVLLLVAASVVIPVLIGVALVVDTKPPSSAEVAEAQQQVERERDSRHTKKEIRRCAEDPTYLGLPGDLTDEELLRECKEQLEPQLEWFLWSPQLDMESEREGGTGVAVILVLGIAMLLAGTTFTGHDWASGSVSNQLLFEPRRPRVWAAKAIVVTGSAFLLAAAVLSSYWLVIGAVARSRDLLGGGVLLDSLQHGWRGAAVAAGAALIGFALTMLFRSTVATLGILFAVALAGGTLLGVLGFEGPWNPAYNVAAVVNDGTTYFVDAPCEPTGEGMPDAGYCGEERVISLERGATNLGGALAACCSISVVFFRRRDVP